MEYADFFGGASNVGMPYTAENLRYLNLSGTSVNNFTGRYEALEHLVFRSCSFLTNMYLLYCPNIKIFNISQTGLTQLPNFVTSNLVEELILDNNLSLPNTQSFSQFPNLKKLTINGTQIANVILEGNLFLENLSIGTCPNLNQIDLSHNVNLKYLRLAGLGLTTLDTSNNLMLEDVNLYINYQLTTLQINNKPLLKKLSFGNEGLGEVSLDGLPNLEWMQYLYSPLSELDISNLPSLNYVQISHSDSLNKVTTNGLSNLSSFKVFECPALTEIEITNSGVLETTSYLGDLPNLSYICTNNYNHQLIVNELASGGITQNVEVNSYCSSDDENLNTLRGVVRWNDNLENCNDLNAPLYSTNLSLTSNDELFATFYNTNGNYQFSVPAGNYNLAPTFENPELFQLAVPNYSVEFEGNNEIQERNFCVAPEGDHNDLEVTFAPTLVARPGFDASYLMLVRNKGNQNASGNVVLNYNDAVLDFVSSSSLPISNSTNMLTYDFSNLLPFQEKVFEITFNVNGPMETPSVNIDDLLFFRAEIQSENTDVTPNDNWFEMNQTVVGAYDPNDKHCLEGSVVGTEKIGDYLHYIINFENTGNFPAERVIISDRINADQFQLNTIQLLSASHSVNMKRTDNHLEFFFENIQLQPLGKGYVQFKIKTQEGLVNGSEVENQAKIYFDYNFPIITNSASTTFTNLSTSTRDISDFRIYPNPTQNILNIKGKNALDSIKIFDLAGREIPLALSSVSDETQQINVSNLQSGVYFLSVGSGEKSKTMKFVKK